MKSRFFWIAAWIALSAGACAKATPETSGGGDGDADSDTDADVDTDSDSDTDVDTDSDSDVDSDTDVDTDVDSDTDSDSDSDADTEGCPYACFTESLCTLVGGTVHAEYACTTEGTVCCEMPDEDTESDTGADTDVDSDTDVDTDVDSDTDVDTDSDADTDTAAGWPCTSELQCLAHYPAIACCDNICVNPLNNVENCGVCGNDCLATEVGNVCTLGECRCGLSGACSPPTDCCQHVLFVWVCDACY